MFLATDHSLTKQHCSEQPVTEEPGLQSPGDPGSLLLQQMQALASVGRRVLWVSCLQENVRMFRAAWAELSSALFSVSQQLTLVIARWYKQWRNSELGFIKMQDCSSVGTRAACLVGYEAMGVPSEETFIVSQLCVWAVRGSKGPILSCAPNNSDARSQAQIIPQGLALVSPSI